MFPLYISSVVGYHFYLNLSIPTVLITPAGFVLPSFNPSIWCLEVKAVQASPTFKVLFKR